MNGSISAVFLQPLGEDRSRRISRKPKNVTPHTTTAGLSLQLWSPTEEKVGFSGTVSDGRGKKVGAGKSQAKGIVKCKREGEERGRRGGHGTTHSHFSTPLFEPPNPKSFLSWQLPARKLFSHRDEGCEGLRLVCSLSGGFTGSTVPETEGDRLPDKRGTMAVTWHD